MESNETTPVSEHQAQKLLEDMTSDRAALADRARAPRWFLAVLAATAATWVASGALADDDVRTGVSFALTVFFVLVAAMFPRMAGVRVRRFGRRTWLTVLGALVGVLVLFSVALGLAVSVSPSWVVVPATVAFALVYGAGRLTEAIHRAEIRHGR